MNIDDAQKEAMETGGNSDQDNSAEENSLDIKDTAKNIKQKKELNLNKKSVITAAGIIIALILIVIAAKGLLFKQPKKISIFGKMGYVINKSSKFPSLSMTKPHTIKKQIAPPAILPKKVAKKVKALAPVKAAQLPVISENMRRMLKFNNTINKLKEEAKIAALNQQIKSLSRTGVTGAGGSSINGTISLIGISKNLAILKFGKKDISMKVGSYYSGYRCLLINKSSVVLEKNNRTVHLNLSL